MGRLTERFDDAMVYASQLHRTQIRKGTTIPYVSHLMAVASLVLGIGAGALAARRLARTPPLVLFGR